MTSPFTAGFAPQQQQAAPSPFSAAPAQQAAPASPFGSAPAQQAPPAASPFGTPAQQQQAAAPQPVVGTFTAAPEPTGSPGFSMKDNMGRLVLIAPTKYEVEAPSKFENKARGGRLVADRVTATVVILDHPSGVPLILRDVWLTQSQLVEQQLRDVCPEYNGGQRGMRLGRIGENGNAIVLTSFTAAEGQAVESWLSAARPTL